MFMVVIGTFAWSSLKLWNKVPLADVLVIVLVTLLTIIFDLAIAVLAGVIVSSLVFAWENAKRIRARKHIDQHGVKHYEIYGPLFFGCIELFNSKFDIKNDPKEVVIDFKESRIVDQSAIECVNKLTERYLKMGKNVHLRHLSSDCVKLIKRAEKICDVNVLEDPDYFVAIDNFRQAQMASLSETN
jgi:SulP family sulfate permease